ncbi:MAG: ABC transporter substrate-binding protein [Candidatus Brachytrichaceae bacterium NZ_4S206]|jgi:glycine betaine/proline transport system substrate-binding protein
MSEKRFHALPRLLPWAVVALMALAACRQAPAAPVAPAEAPAATAPAAAPAQPIGEKPVIKLAENPWTGSSVNVYVAKQLLEEKLGYTVEVVTIDENAQWPAVAKGDISAILEIWPSGETHQKGLKQYVEGDKTVLHLGELGVVGKISWYVPKYVVDAHPELATWEGFKNPELAKLFATAETGDAGQFLAGDPSWVQYDEEIIRNLGLNLKVVRAGSEQAVLAALDSAYSRKEPILFYLWTPHSVHNKYELVPVKLPEYTDECYAEANAGKKACDYPKDVLFKVANAKLKEIAPDAFQFLANMKLTDADQISMIADVELNGKTPAEAAKAWIEKNEAVWSQWLPK